MMGDGENRPGTARVARNAYPQLRPGRPIDAQYGANFARENRWELVPIARGNPQPFCDIRRPGRESGSWGPHTSHRIVLYASFVGHIPVTFVTRRASRPEGATAFSSSPRFDRERGCAVAHDHVRAGLARPKKCSGEAEAGLRHRRGAPLRIGSRGGQQRIGALLVRSVCSSTDDRNNSSNSRDAMPCQRSTHCGSLLRPVG